MQPPPVILWFKVYAFAMAALYLLCIAFGVFIILFGNGTMEMPSQEALVVGTILAVVAGPLLLVYAAAPFLPRTSWAWIVDLILIAFGFTSCCTLPFCIALLIFWLRPDVKAYFNRV